MRGYLEHQGRKFCSRTFHDLGITIHIILIEPIFPTNAGSIGRTCLGFGSKLHLVGPLGFSLDEKYVKRSGLDYWQRVDKSVWENWGEFEKNQLPLIDYKYYFSTKAPDSLINYRFSTDITVPIKNKSIGLFFGSESKGLYDILGAEKMSNGRVLRLPMNDHIDAAFRSFNLYCTVGMVIWDIYKEFYHITKQ